jgi:hypothetical protein
MGKFGQFLGDVFSGDAEGAFETIGDGLEQAGDTLGQAAGAALDIIPNVVDEFIPDNLNIFDGEAPILQAGYEFLTGGGSGLADHVLDTISQSIAGQPSATEDDQPNYDNSTGQSVPGQSQIVPAPPTAGPVPDCYAMCQLNDKIKAAKCKQLNDAHIAAVKAMGCGAVTCSLPSLQPKVCSLPASSACYKPTVYRKTQVTKCGCR